MITESKQWVYGCLLQCALNLLVFEIFHNKKVGKNKKDRKTVFSINGNLDPLPHVKGYYESQHRAKQSNISVYYLARALRRSPARLRED